MKQTITKIKDRQSLHWVEVRDYSVEGAVRNDLYRVVIHRDAYDEQSYARVERWSDVNGWMFVHALGNDAEFYAFPRMYPANRTPDFTPIVNSANELWAFVEQFFTHTPRKTVAA